MAKERKSGRCLCGGVRFTVDNLKSGMGACHCEMCRRWGSGPFIAVDCGHEVHFEGEENVCRYRSSEWAERGFCKICGTNLFYYIIENGEYILSVGAFDDQEYFKFKSQIFIDGKPGYYDFANETRMMTGEEVFAMYSGDAKG